MNRAETAKAELLGKGYEITYIENAHRTECIIHHPRWTSHGALLPSGQGATQQEALLNALQNWQLEEAKRLKQRQAHMRTLKPERKVS